MAMPCSGSVSIERYEKTPCAYARVALLDCSLLGRDNLRIRHAKSDRLSSRGDIDLTPQAHNAVPCLAKCKYEF